MIHVLLCQVGTIESLEKKSVKKYLRRFLSDDRIIYLPKIFWRPILEIIIPVRQKKVLNFYRDIWTPHGSPLYATSLVQQKALQEKLGGEFAVELFLSFTDSHSIEKVYAKMKQDGLEKIIVIPLFPQFSTATTSGVIDTIFSKLFGWNGTRKKVKTHIPAIYCMTSFYNNDRYKKLYITHVQKGISALPNKPSTVIVSFHGLPKRYIFEGDVYQKHCEETFEYIQKAFLHSSTQFILTYQSRFGAEQWLGPRTEDTVQELAAKHPDDTVAVICPGFVTDCLETLSEIDRELRNTYEKHGGNRNKFFYIPCLNTSDEFIQFLASSIQQSASGFVR